MKHLLIIGLITLFSLPVYGLGRSNVGVNFGMAPGGVTLGGEYEHLMKRGYGLGGFARFFQKDSAKTNGKGIFALGANARIHHRIDQFEFSVAPGVALINVDDRTDDTTSLGPSFSLALTYEFKEGIALGLENTRYWIWLDEDFRGLVIDDTSLRMTFNF